MADNIINVELDYKSLKKQLEEFDRKMPNSSKKLMAKVNREVVKQLRREASSRGYKAHNKKSWGDAGYQPNFDQYAFNNYTGEIFIKSNAFHYRFIEFGSDVKPKKHKYLTFKYNGQWYKSEGFHLQANPILEPIANSIWATSKANEIMDAELQRIMDKQFNRS